METKKKDKSPAELKAADAARKRKERAAARENKELERLADESIGQVWQKFSKQLAASNKALYHQLNERHLDVTATISEVADIERALRDGLEPEIHPAECLESIVDDVAKFGSANYRELEAIKDPATKENSFRPRAGEQLDTTDAASCYRFLGMMLKIPRDVIRLAAEALVRFTLKHSGVVDSPLLQIALKIVDECGSYDVQQAVHEYRHPKVAEPATKPEARKIRIVDMESPLPEPVHGWVQTHASQWPRSK
jgi:hypothetical protein